MNSGSAVDDVVVDGSGCELKGLKLGIESYSSDDDDGDDEETCGFGNVTDDDVDVDVLFRRFGGVPFRDPLFDLKRSLLDFCFVLFTFFLTLPFSLCFMLHY